MYGDEIILLREILEEMQKQTAEMASFRNTVYQISEKVGNIEKILREMEIELFGEAKRGKGK